MIQWQVLGQIITISMHLVIEHWHLFFQRGHLICGIPNKCTAVDHCSQANSNLDECGCQSCPRSCIFDVSQVRGFRSPKKFESEVPYSLHLAPRVLSKLKNDFAILPCNQRPPLVISKKYFLSFFLKINENIVFGGHIFKSKGKNQ